MVAVGVLTGAVAVCCTGLRRAPMWSEKTCIFSSAHASIWIEAQNHSLFNTGTSFGTSDGRLSHQQSQVSPLTQSWRPDRRPHLPILKTSAFSTNVPTRLASIVLHGVMGPLLLGQQSMVSLYLCISGSSTPSELKGR